MPAVGCYSPQVRYSPLYVLVSNVGKIALAVCFELLLDSPRVLTPLLLGGSVLSLIGVCELQCEELNPKDGSCARKAEALTFAADNPGLNLLLVFPADISPKNPAMRANVYHVNHLMTLELASQAASSRSCKSGKSGLEAERLRKLAAE